MNYNPPATRDLDAWKSDGTKVASGDQGVGVQLGVATYYIPLAPDGASMPGETELASLHLKWPAAFAATITIEVSNFPGKIDAVPGEGPDDVTDYDQTAGNWIGIKLAAEDVEVVGGGNSVAADAVTAGGANAGGAIFNLPQLGARRARAKLVVTAGATIRARSHGKVG